MRKGGGYHVDQYLFMSDSVKMLLFKKKSNSVFLLVVLFQAPIPLTYRKGSTINLVIFMTAELP